MPILSPRPKRRSAATGRITPTAVRGSKHRISSGHHGFLQKVVIRLQFPLQIRFVEQARSDEVLANNLRTLALQRQQRRDLAGGE